MTFNPLSLLSGVWGYVGAAALAGALSVGATHYIDAKTYGLDIATLKLTAAQKQSADVSASLSQLQGFIGRMTLADTNYNATLAAINANFATLKGAIANVKISAPLPIDCRPDTNRLSILTNAVAAANKAPATPSP